MAGVISDTDEHTTRAMVSTLSASSRTETTDIEDEQSLRIHPINRIVPSVDVKIALPTAKEDRILRRPPSRRRIITSRPKPHQTRHVVVKSPRKPKRLKPRISIRRDITPHIIIHPLRHRSIRWIYDEPHTASLVADDAVADAALDHVIGSIGREFSSSVVHSVGKFSS